MNRPKNFRCTKCKAAFPASRDLKRHENRKIPCAPILTAEDLSDEKKNSPNKCRFCGRAFAHATSVARHIKNSCKIAPRNGDTSGMELLYEHTLKKQLEDQRKEMRAMEERLTTLIKGSIAATASTTLVETNQHAKAAKTISRSSRTAIATTGSAIDQSVGKTTNVQINIFGQENISHITGGKIKQLFDSITGRGTAELKDLLPAAQMAIVQATMLIYSDEEHPENITCYLPNKKTDDVLIHGEAGWEVKPYPMAVSPMAARAITVLFDKQPMPGQDGVDETADIEQCGKILRHLADNEKELTVRPPSLRPVLVRNKDLLAKYLAKLPVARDK